MILVTKTSDQTRQNVCIVCMCMYVCVCMYVCMYVFHIHVYSFLPSISGIYIVLVFDAVLLFCCLDATHLLINIYFCQVPYVLLAEVFSSATALRRSYPTRRNMEVRCEGIETTGLRSSRPKLLTYAIEHAESSVGHRALIFSD